MGFVLGGLDTEAYDRTYSDRELVRRIVGYFRPHTRQMILVAVMLTLNSVARTGGPILIGRAIDILAEDPSAEVLWLLAGAVLLFGAAAWVFNYIRQLWSARVVGNVVLSYEKTSSMPRYGMTSPSSTSTRPARSSAASLQTHRISLPSPPW